MKAIVFDMDDVMWNLNEKVAELTGIPYEKMDTFLVQDNQNLTNIEKGCILDAYQSPATFEDIRFRDGAISLINELHSAHPEYKVMVVSNCYGEAVRNRKLSQLRRILRLPEENICLHVIGLEAAGKKQLPDNVFIFIDDSPHNIENANAMHKIMPAKPYNNVPVDADRPETDEELQKIVMAYIEKGE